VQSAEMSRFDASNTNSVLTQS